ncbi:hypothetical protein MSPP1_001960 [Malassezia sp. CBS 17886]|nr:hypothetical protein MSPP1_001960 [Malassezia sp. CBS 17886]
MGPLIAPPSVRLRAMQRTTACISAPPRTARDLSLAPREGRTYDVALPATPDTYLALRASQYELRALPETSLESLIHHAGRAGLSGLIADILDDVLGERAADAQSLRQQRLLAALVCTSSQYPRRVPLAPRMLVRMAEELLMPRGFGSVDEAALQKLPPFTVMHILRRALALPSGDTAQHALIMALFRHLAQTGTYPLVEEGLHVLQHLLRYGDIDAGTSMSIVSAIMAEDGDRLGEQTLQQARADGIAWGRWARAAEGLMEVSAVRQSVSDGLQARSLRISLWSLCCRAWLRLNRPRRFCDALAHLVRECDEADAVVQRRASPSRAAAPPRVTIVRALLQAHLVNLVGAHTRNALRAALAALHAAPPRDVANVAASIVAQLGDAANALGAHTVGAQICLVVLDARAVVGGRDATAALLRAMGPLLSLCVFEALSRGGQYARVQALLDECMDAIGQDAWDAYWAPQLRPRLLTCLARSGRSGTVRTLYARWSDSDGTVLSAAELEVLITRCLASRARQGAPHIADAHAAAAVPSWVEKSPQCILAIVALLGRRPRWRAGEAASAPTGRSAFDILWATRVRDDYLRALAASHHVSHYDLTALAQASFAIGDHRTGMAAACACLADPDTVDTTDVAVLLRGLADTAPETAASVLAEWPVGDTAAARAVTASLYAVLMSRCLHTQRIDTAQSVYNAGVARGLGMDLARHSPAVVLALSDDPPDRFVPRVVAMIRDNWRPEPCLVHWMIRSAARGLSLRRAHYGKRESRLVSDAHVLQAMALFCVGAQRLGHVDLPTARLLLYHFAGCARVRARRLPEATPLWVAELDGVVASLRWCAELTGAAAYGAMTQTPPRDSVQPARRTSQSSLVALQPNVLPAALFQQLIQAYLGAQDADGAHQVADWMHSVGMARPRQFASSTSSALRAFSAARARRHSGE